MIFIIMKNVSIYFLLFVLLFYFHSCKKSQPEIKPEVQKLTEAVYASGYIRPKNEYQVISMAEGYLAKKLVNEGAAIQKNELLFIIKSDQQDVKTQNASNVYQLA